jgi:hypothetical protein
MLVARLVLSPVLRSAVGPIWVGRLPGRRHRGRRRRGPSAAAGTTVAGARVRRRRRSRWWPGSPWSAGAAHRPVAWPTSKRSSGPSGLPMLTAVPSGCRRRERDGR